MALKKKVLFLSNWYPHRGDSQFGVFTKKHAKAISIYAEVVSLYIQSDLEMNSNYELIEEQDNGLKEITVYFKKSQKSFKPLQRLINLYRYIKALRLGFEKIRHYNFQADICHANILVRPAFIAFLIKLRYGTPYIITEHWTGYRSGAFDDASWFQKSLARFLAKQASGITTVSNALQKSMEKLNFDNQFYIISNVIDSIPEQLQAKNSDAIVRIINVSDHVDWKKGITQLIRTFSEIERTIPNIELHLIGDGPDHHLVKKAAKNAGLLESKIKIYGRKSNSFVLELMPQMDFLVVNSTLETFSVVTAEALAFGKPVIVTRSGGPEEFVDENYGLLINPNSPKELKSAIITMIENHKNYDATALSDYAKQKFSSETIGKQFVEIYNIALNKK